MRSIYLAAAIANLTCMVSVAQPIANSTVVYRNLGEATAPNLIFRPQPEYSEQALTAKLQGSVMLAAVIGEDGRPREVRVEKSVGLGLDERAIASVVNWRFAPATKSGLPIPVESTIEVNFRMPGDAREWHPTHVAFNVPTGAAAPVLVTAQSAPLSGLPENATARVSFYVDAQGVPRNIQVEESSDPKYVDEVIALIREWRFQAALDHGAAIEVHAAIDLSRGLSQPAPTTINGMPVKPPMKKR